MRLVDGHRENRKVRRAPTVRDGVAPQGVDPSRRSEPVATDCAPARTIWRDHQADRAWIEWGFCWPPLSVARPRCTACRSPWPCPPALRAHDLLTGGPSSTGLQSVSPGRLASPGRIVRGAR